MAQCTRFTCSHCAFGIDSWDDGNPYFADAAGKRHYFYHPGGESAMRAYYQVETALLMETKTFAEFAQERSGNEGDWLCENCGRQTQRDPRRDSMRCSGCKQETLIANSRLEGRPCPKCKNGTFKGEFTGIS